MNTPLISVVLPARARPKALLDVLAALATQDQVPRAAIEVVVVVDGADPALTARLNSIRAGYRLEVVERVRGGTAAAYDAGWRRARADVVLFLADSVCPDENLLSGHLRVHRDSPGAVVLGAIRPQPGPRSAIDAYEDRMRSKKQGRLRRRERPAGIHDVRNVSLPKAALEAVGGFQLWLPVDADVDLGERLRAAGHRFIYRPQAQAVDTGGQPIDEWCNRYRTRGRLALTLHSRRHYRGGPETLVACFHDLHPINRMAVRLALGSRERTRHIVGSLTAVGFWSHRVGLRLASAAAFSILANILYWSGVRDGLRGTAEFWRLVRKTRRHAGRPYELVSAHR